MRILYVITRSDSVGGAQYHLRDLACAMQERGHDVHLVVGGSDGPFYPLLDQVGLSYTRMPSLVRPVRPLLDWKCIRELKKVISHVRPDVVHCHSSKAGILGRFAANSCRVPAIFSAHGWSFTDGVNPRSARLYLATEKLAARWCDRILVGCESDREMGLTKKVADRRIIQTIWYGLKKLPGEPLADPGKSPPNMVMVARFEEQKDHETLLRALGLVRQLDWTIDLLGDGPLRPAMEALANELEIADRVRFVGVQPTHEFWLKSQLALMITKWEGLPLSTLEAMRVGLPVIGTHIGGIPEQITDGVSGYLVPRGDCQRLAERLGELLTSPELRLRYGQAGKQRFDADFQHSRMLDQVEKVYTEACGGKRGAKQASQAEAKIPAATRRFAHAGETGENR